MGTLLRSDRRLVAQVLKGRNDRFEPLVHRYLPAVRGIAYTRLGNMADAEDAAQDAFVTAYQKLGDLREPDRFGPWIMTIARHAASRVSTKRGKEAPLSDQEADRLPASTPDPSDREVWSLVRTHLEDLPESTRDALALHYFAGHTTREIAVLLNISQAAVLKRLQRGREQLGAALVETLAGTTESKRGLEKQAARIAAIATASSLYNTATGGTAAAAVGVPALIKGTAAIGVAALLTAGATFFALSVPANRGETVTIAPAPDLIQTAAASVDAGAPDTVADPAPAIVLAQANETELETESAASTSEAIAEPETVSSEAEGSEPATVQSISGLWKLRAGDDGTGMLVNYGQVAITQNGNQVEAELANERTQQAFRATGVLNGRYLSMDMVVEGDIELRPQGEVSEEWDRITLRASSPEILDEMPSGTIRFELERAEEDVVEAAARRAALRDEVQAMFDALQAWRAANGGVYPEEATAREVLEAALPDNEVRRQVFYEPVPTTLTYPSDLPRPSELMSDGTFYPDLPLPDRLVLLEEALGDRWGGDLGILLAPVLDVRYPDDEVRFHATDAQGVLEIPWNEDEELPLMEHGALRAACANNMKQLGLHCILFQTQVSGYFPAGFNVLYPHYLANPEILRCPTRHGDTISYEFLFPGYAHEYLLAIEADFLSVDPEDVPRGTWGYGGIPFMVETHDCAGRTGAGLRHVLFLDGHVETLKPEDYEARIEPYLEYR